MKELEIMAHTDLERIQYEQRQKAIFDEASRRRWYEMQKDEGRKEGIKEGEQIALRKFKLIQQIREKQQVLGCIKTSADDLFQMPEEELQHVLSELDTNE